VSKEPSTLTVPHSGSQPANRLVIRFVKAMLIFASHRFRNRIMRTPEAAMTVTRWLRCSRIVSSHDGIRLDLNEPIRVDKAHNLHYGVGGADAAKELAVDCCDLLPILYTG